MPPTSSNTAVLMVIIVLVITMVIMAQEEERLCETGQRGLFLCIRKMSFWSMKEVATCVA